MPLKPSVTEIAINPRSLSSPSFDIPSTPVRAMFHAQPNIVKPQTSANAIIASTYAIFFEPCCVARKRIFHVHYEYQRKFQKYNVNAINAHSMRIETKRIPIRIECASSVNRP